jgi:glycosyltransferase involved in cell wall biosynthesis
MDIEATRAENAPRVSVVMGLATVDAYLRPAINSILDQTFKDFEFIIVVDEGVPSIRQEILSFYSNEHRIKIMQSPALGGLAYALNMGIGQARGEYIARMDGDDLSLPDRLMEQVRFMDENKDVAVLGCRVPMIDANSEKLNREYPYYQTNREIRRALPFRNPLVHPALMFRKTALLAVHGYKYGNSAEDYEMFIRMARNPDLKFHNLDKVLFAYRRHNLQATNLNRVKSNYYDKSGYLFTEFLRSRSLRYLGGIFVMHPIIYRVRMFFRRRLRGNED